MAAKFAFAKIYLLFIRNDEDLFPQNEKKLLTGFSLCPDWLHWPKWFCSSRILWIADNSPFWAVTWICDPQQSQTYIYLVFSWRVWSLLSFYRRCWFPTWLQAKEIHWKKSVTIRSLLHKKASKNFHRVRTSGRYTLFYTLSSSRIQFWLCAKGWKGFWDCRFFYCVAKKGDLWFFLKCTSRFSR